MKRVWIVLLGCLICCACHKVEKDVVTVWLLPETNGFHIEIASTPLSERDLDMILNKAAYDGDHFRLVISLCKGVPASNASGALFIAEKHGFTDVTVRLNQTPPPKRPFNGVIHD
jgi:hypothetical protein